MNRRYLQAISHLFGRTADGRSSEIIRHLNPLARTGPRIFVQVLLGMVILFSIAGFLTRSYRAERRNRALYHFQVGRTLAEQGQEPEAIEHYRAALSLARGNSEYQLALALALLGQGRLGEAEKYLNELLHNDPTNGIANSTMARIASQREDFNNAEMYYHRAIYGFWPTPSEHDRLQVRLELVDLLARAGAKQRLLAELILLQNELPEDTGIKKRVARLFLSADGPSRAAGIFRELLRENRQDAEAYVGLGEAEFVQRNYSSAQTALRNATRLNPNDPVASRMFGLANEILALDPTVRGLSVRERHRRSRELVRLALGKIEPCISVGQHLPSPTVQQAVETARDLLSRNTRPRRIEEATEANLSLAEQLWQARQDLCPSNADQDVAALVLAKLAQ